MLDDFGIQRFAGGADFAKRCFARLHVLLHQHAPYSGRRAERSHLIRSDSPQHITCVETWLVGDEYRGTSIPRCKKTAIRMLRPTRRRDVEMHVAKLQTKPVHCDQMPDRIALMTMLHQFGTGGGTRGEIEQHWISCVRRSVWREA